MFTYNWPEVAAAPVKRCPGNMCSNFCFVIAWRLFFCFCQKAAFYRLFQLIEECEDFYMMNSGVLTKENTAIFIYTKVVPQYHPSR